MAEHKGTLLLEHTQIVIQWTDGRQEAFRLGEVTRIGRGKNGNDILIPDEFQSVSRRHMEIRHEREGYRLIDLGSRNGVLLNGVYVKDTYLRDRDEIRIGHNGQGQSLRIEFQMGSDSSLAETPADGMKTASPSSGLANESPVNTPHFRVRWHNGRIFYFPVLKERNLIGRSPEADLRIPETLRFVSGRHVEVVNRPEGFFVRDLNSTNGTLLNNRLIQPGQFYPLFHDSIIRFGDDEFGISVSFTFSNPLEQSRLMDGFLQAAPPIQITKVQHVLVGRLPSCSIILEHPEVSRRHAIARQVEDRYFIQDLDSSNGTLVNSQPIQEVELHDGDLVQIGTFLLLFQDGQLIPYRSGGLRLDVMGLSKDVKTGGGTRRILDDICLTILPREFVTLVGGSGAGKSALLNALAGLRPGQGQVRLNGLDFYQEHDSFRSQLGYVPRSEILHDSLPVEVALDYAARLRLPGGLTLQERWNRIDTVLDTVSMNTAAIRRTRISDLSVEQRKRLSIAAELLADPGLIYLDDAMSGLDPGLEKKMMHTLRRMADEGRTVVLATHATNNIVQSDHVAFLSEGKLVYFGPPGDLMNFFEVDEYADIYEAVDYKGEEWRKVFEEKKPALYHKYVEDRQRSLDSLPQWTSPKAGVGITDLLRQLLVLTQRSLSVLASRPVNLFLMLLLFPVTAILQLVIARPDLLTGDLAILANPAAAAQTMMESYTPFPHTNIFVFVMALEAMLTGLFLSSTDLVQERSIYLRERMVNLKVLPYLLSKTLLYSVFVFVQVVLYLLILSLGVDIPGRGLYFNGYIELFITLFLTMMAGISCGLIVSAVSKSTRMALYILAILLFFQLFFAGTLFDLRGNRFEPLSYLSTTRWSSAALGTTIDMERIAESTVLCVEVPENTQSPGSALKTICFNYPYAREDLRLVYGEEQLLISWGVLSGMTILFLSLTWLLLLRQDPGRNA